MDLTGTAAGGGCAQCAGGSAFTYGGKIARVGFGSTTAETGMVFEGVGKLEVLAILVGIWVYGGFGFRGFWKAVSACFPSFELDCFKVNRINAAVYGYVSFKRNVLMIS